MDTLLYLISGVGVLLLSFALYLRTKEEIEDALRDARFLQNKKIIKQYKAKLWAIEPLLLIRFPQNKLLQSVRETFLQRKSIVAALYELAEQGIEPMVLEQLIKKNSWSLILPNARV